MDALPLSVNRSQLELLYEGIKKAIAKLQDKHQAGQFSSKDSEKREQNLLIYGTNEYSQANARTESIEEQLKTQLESWDSADDASKPVPLSLDSYQLKVLRMSLENEINALKDETKKELLSRVIEQLPEFSLQEDAD